MTDENGEVFLLSKKESITIEANMIGFFPKSGKFEVPPSKKIIVALTPKTILSEEVIITGVNILKDQPTTFSKVNRAELAKLNLGQDIPYILQGATSVVSNSDAGNSIGYTGVSIRGSDASRINVTMNGIPINDAESHGLFWVNMPDFVSSVDEVQIQRGVGSSTNGSSAFGASINFMTNQLKEKAYCDLTLGGGSFNSQRLTLSSGTGLINNHWTMDMRLSKIKSDGFIDRAKADLSGLMVSGAHYGKKGSTKINLLLGQETTYQAWNGVPESKLNNNEEELVNFILRNGLSSSDSLHLVSSSSRTYNSYTYKNQTDNYSQNHYQLFHTQNISSSGVLNIALHGTVGKGYFEEFRPNDFLTNYGLPPATIVNDTINTVDLIRQRWLDNVFLGTVYSYQQTINSKTTFVTGGGFNYYEGEHFGKIIWSSFSSNFEKDHEYYRNTGIKRDFNHYAKISHTINNKLLLFGDLQIRVIDYRFTGFNQNLISSAQKVNYLFFNPKAGITYFMNDRNNLYLSYAKSEREPVRDDFVNSSPESRPKPEIMHNSEFGWRFQSNKLKASVNHYLMFYQNQLVLTGKINDVGAYTRSNVEKSYRTGMEGEFLWQVLEKMVISGNATYSLNKVLNYEFYNFDYDEGVEVLLPLKSSPISFSPSIIAGLEIAMRPWQNFEFGLFVKHVGRQFLDNTGSIEKSVDPYSVFNFRASKSFQGKKIKNCSIKILVNNLFNTAYESHGYTYGCKSGGRQINENFYYPQAGINFMVGTQISF